MLSIKPARSRRVAKLRALFVLAGALAALSVVLINLGDSAVATGAEPNPCAAPITNPIACENSKEGDPPGDWQIKGIGDKTIQGFATAISVNPGETENFKINTDASKYNIRILRLGYYKGDGARVIEPAFKPSAQLPQTQPACMHEKATGLTDCGNWAVSASWKVPSDAVSGLYMAELEREDTGGASQIFFVVKNEESHAPIVLKTSDATWEAYNAYGGNSLYNCTNEWCPEGKPEAYKAAYAVSYNRPFDGSIETDAGQSAPFYAEYQLMRWLEKNGYNVTYLAQPDIQAHPELLKNHKVFISSGHDEYWSGEERAAVESAREAGVNLAFFSGNEVFWKTRYAPSMEGTQNRTLISYKETHFNEPKDPLEPNVATSSWADARFKSGGAAKPPNSLTGQYFVVNAGTSDIKVPGTFAKLRFWRNTAVSKLASNETLTLSPGAGTLGYEWDEDANNGFRPAGRISLSSTTVNGVQTFTDYGTTTASETTATHSLSLYRAPSGALVFGAGTVDWSWGLDNTNAWNVYTADPSGNAPDPTMEQATVNLLADMGVQPGTLTSGLVAATESTDKTPPEVTVTSPTVGKSVNGAEALSISGTANDLGGGVVAGVEVSVDGGKTWNPANGTTSWSYSWPTDGTGPATIEARAIDDSGNISNPTAGINVPINCPCSILGARTPEVADSGDRGSTNVGVKFQSEVPATVEGMRFYKATANTGTHVGSLWTANGELLAQATFTNETASGWQKVTFATPVKIAANTTYVASYLAPKGHYSATAWSLDEPPANGEAMLSHPPMRLLADTEGGNGVYAYASTTTFPKNSYHAGNYWVDVLYKPSNPPAVPGQVSGVSATAGRGQATVTWSAPSSGGAPASYKITPYIGATAQTATTVSSTETSKTITGLTAGTAYTFTVTATNETGSGAESAKSNAVTPTAITVPGAPTGVSATVGGSAATVVWTAPADNGGSAITGYKVTPYLESVAQAPVSVEAGVTTKTVNGLTAGASYTFTVMAVNAVGQSAESSPSNAVTPKAATAPSAPTAVSATAKSSGALVSWTAPAEDGGSTITGYRITPYLGGVAQTATTTSTAATSAGVTGLTNGSAYTFKVAAINGVGAGAESAASAAVTPYDTIFDLATPGTVDAGDAGAVNLGVKFTSDSPGKITGIRYYKAAANTGTHVGTLWTANGEALAQVTFSGETETGWQQATFATPVQIKANTTYVASYLAPKGHYSANGPTLATAVDNPPLHALGGATNGVYAYGSTTKFPTETWQSSNYWVDVLFVPEASATVPAAPTGVTATAGANTVTVSWTAPENGGSAITSYEVTPYKQGVAQAPVAAAAGETSKTLSGLTAGASYTFTVIAVNSVGKSAASAPSNAVTLATTSAPGAPTAVSAVSKTNGAAVSWTAPSSDGGSAITGYKVTPYLEGVAQAATTTSTAATSATINGLTNGSAYTFKVAAINSIGTGVESAASAAITPADTIFELGTPSTVDSGEAKAINLGVSFRSDVPGKVTGIRFYKAAANTGTHVGTLWTAGGEVLAQATFTNETESGWQQVTFSSPVSIQANTTYVASYLAPSGHYSANGPNLASAVDNPPLHAEAESGAYTYGSTTQLPTTKFENANYWVDVMFIPEVAPSTPAAPTATAGSGSATVSWTAPGGGTATSYVVTPYVGSTAGTPKTVTGSPLATTTTFGELTPGTAYTFTVKASNGAGASAESAPSNSVTPFAGSVPSAPSSVTAQARNGAAVVSWSAPAENGGSAITGYKVTPYLGSEALTATIVGGEATTATIGSLTNGNSYTFKVAAINSIGAGPTSAATEAVIPRITLFEQTIPTTAEATDAASVMLGLKFGSTVAGKVRGVRFYKAPGNVGPHSVGLWTSSGTLLASATATNETASGWQEVLFPAPVSIAANTMYVAAYLAPKGHYTATQQGFATQISNGPLVGLANGTSVNGLYSYRSTLSFPVSSYLASNFWVDVMFTP